MSKMTKCAVHQNQLILEQLQALGFQSEAEYADHQRWLAANSLRGLESFQGHARRVVEAEGKAFNAIFAANEVGVSPATIFFSDL